MSTHNIAPRKFAGIVVSAGKMMKTIKVRMIRQEWNRKLRKFYSIPYNLLVNDHNNSVMEGDVVSLTPERHSKHVLHTVKAILAPFGKPLEERPPLLTQEQREAMYADKRARKLERRHQRDIEALRIKQEASAQRRPGRQRLKEELGQQKHVDDGGKGGGKGPQNRGREVLRGGLHKFGSVNQEAMTGRRRAKEKQRKGQQQVQEKEEVEQKPQENIQEEALGIR